MSNTEEYLRRGGEEVRVLQWARKLRHTQNISSILCARVLLWVCAQAGEYNAAKCSLISNVSRKREATTICEQYDLVSVHQDLSVMPQLKLLSVLNGSNAEPLTGFIDTKFCNYPYALSTVGD